MSKNSVYLNRSSKMSNDSDMEGIFDKMKKLRPPERYFSPPNTFLT